MKQIFMNTSPLISPSQELLCFQTFAYRRIRKVGLTINMKTSQTSLKASGECKKKSVRIYLWKVFQRYILTLGELTITLSLNSFTETRNNL